MCAKSNNSSQLTVEKTVNFCLKEMSLKDICFAFTQTRNRSVTVLLRCYLFSFLVIILQA